MRAERVEKAMRVLDFERNVRTECAAGRVRISETRCTDFGNVAHGYWTRSTSRILEGAAGLRGSIERWRWLLLSRPNWMKAWWLRRRRLGRSRVLR